MYREREQLISAHTHTHTKITDEAKIFQNRNVECIEVKII